MPGGRRLPIDRLASVGPSARPNNCRSSPTGQRIGADLRHAHFWGMDEWVVNGREVPENFPLSFARTDRELLFHRIRPDLRMPESNIHFPRADAREYTETWNRVRCVVMQGGQGEVKHWAFNDPPRRVAPFDKVPPSPAEYRKLTTCVVDLHPMTIIQNARTSGGGVVGHELHYMNLANGCCGSSQYDAATIARMRLEEAKAAAQFAGRTCSIRRSAMIWRFSTTARRC